MKNGMNLWILDIMIKGRGSMKDTVTALNNSVKGTFFKEICLKKLQSLLGAIKVKQVANPSGIICTTQSTFEDYGQKKNRINQSIITKMKTQVVIALTITTNNGIKKNKKKKYRLVSRTVALTV